VDASFAPGQERIELMENRKEAGEGTRPAGPRAGGCALAILALMAAHSGMAMAEPQPTPAGAAHAAVSPHVPQGYGKAKFGISFEQAHKLYPALTKAGSTSAAYFRSPNLTRYWMTKVKVPGLKDDCSVEFRFWKDRLWSIIVYYGANPSGDVMENLAREFGPPTVRTSDPSWTLGRVTIITSPPQMWYSFDDGEIGKDVRREFMEAVQREQQRKAAVAQAPAAAAASSPVTPPAPTPPTGTPPAGGKTPGAAAP